MSPTAQALVAELAGEAQALAAQAQALAARAQALLLAESPGGSAAEPQPQVERLLTVAQAAERAGCAEITVRRAIRAGGLAHRRIGRCVRIAPADLEAWQRPPEPKQRQQTPRRRSPRTLEPPIDWGI